MVAGQSYRVHPVILMAPDIRLHTLPCFSKLLSEFIFLEFKDRTRQCTIEEIAVCFYLWKMRIKRKLGHLRSYATIWNEWKLARIVPILKVVQKMTGLIVGQYQFLLSYLDYLRS